MMKRIVLIAAVLASTGCTVTVNMQAPQPVYVQAQPVYMQPQQPVQAAVVVPQRQPHSIAAARNQAEARRRNETFGQVLPTEPCGSYSSANYLCKGY